MREKRLYLMLVLCFFGASLLGFGNNSPTASAAGDQTLNIGVLKGTQFFPMAAMQSKGLEKKYGLDLKIIPMASPAAIHIAINGHQVDAAFSTWQTYAVGRSKGADPLVIAPVNYYVNGIIVKKNSPAKSLQDLIGKKLGTSYGPGHGTALLLQYAAKREFGLDLNTQIELREAATPLLLGLLEKGELDAVYLGEPNLTKSLAGGKYKQIWDVDETFKKLGKAVPLQLCVVTTDQAMKTKKEALKKFVAAYAEAKNILTTDDQIWPELAKEVNLKGDEEVGLLKKSLQASYVQTWNKSFVDSELKLNYEIADLQKGVKFIPDKIPEGFFSFSVYNK
jgi:NitT/TauT family transport system substrate-binding protein